MSESLSHDKLYEALTEDFMRELGCDRQSAEIMADRQMGAMHDGETCPVCLAGPEPLPAVEKFDDLTPEEQLLCDEILTQRYLITALPANAGRDEDMVVAVKEYYRLRCDLITSINDRSSRSWHVDEVGPLVDAAQQLQYERDLAEAEMESRYNF